MHKAIIKSNRNKRGYYAIFFDKMRHMDENNLTIFSVGEGDNESYYIADEKILRIVYDNKTTR